MAKYQNLSFYNMSDITKIGGYLRHQQERLNFEFITKRVKKGSTILEIGSGRGEFAEIAISKGFKYIGIEPSESARKNLLKRGFNILSNPVPEIDLKNESVDLVHSSAVIEHLENYDTVLEFFRETKRVLKEDGIVSSIVPNCTTIGMIFQLYDYQHNFITNRGRIEKLLKDAGFEIILTKPYLTRLGFTKFRFLDRIYAHSILLFFRSPLIHSLLNYLVGDKFTFRIYKNLFDLLIIIAKKQ